MNVLVCLMALSIKLAKSLFKVVHLHASASRLWFQGINLFAYCRYRAKGFDGISKCLRGRWIFWRGFSPASARASVNKVLDDFRHTLRFLLHYRNCFAIFSRLAVVFGQTHFGFAANYRNGRAKFVRSVCHKTLLLFKR